MKKVLQPREEVPVVRFVLMLHCHDFNAYFPRQIVDVLVLVNREYLSIGSPERIHAIFLR